MLEATEKVQRLEIIIQIAQGAINTGPAQIRNLQQAADAAIAAVHRAEGGGG